MDRSLLSSFCEESESTSKLNKILFIDAHNLFYRLLFVCNNEYQNKRKEVAINMEDIWEDEDMYNYWKHLVLNNLFTNIKEHNPNKVIIAVDGSNNWRKSVYSEYKANRKVSREKSIIDFEAFFEILTVFINNLRDALTNVYVLRIDGCEADDIIAVLVKKFSNDNDNKMELISTDKDFLQLQKYKNIKQFDPIKKKYLTSINPEREIEIKVLAGDRGDNIPGVKKRCGPKTAEKMLNEGLADILKDEDIKKNYIRNRTLINFEYIPEYIQNKILDVYDAYEISELNPMSMWTFLNNEKLTKLLDEWQGYVPIFSKLS